MSVLQYVCHFQHYMMMLGSTVSIPFIICPAMCMEPSDPAKGYIISTIIFISGIVTLLQTTLGVRLVVVLIREHTYEYGTHAFRIEEPISFCRDLRLESNCTYH